MFPQHPALTPRLAPTIPNWKCLLTVLPSPPLRRVLPDVGTDCALLPLYSQGSDSTALSASLNADVSDYDLERGRYAE